MRLLLHQPGLRVYLVEGRADAGRLKRISPAVGARMVTVHRYDARGRPRGPRGFQRPLRPEMTR